MKKLLVLVAVGIMILAASCDTKNIGTGWPQRGPSQIVVTVPANMFGNENATWNVSWFGINAPYDVAWNFGGGAANATVDNVLSPSSTTATMINNTAAPVTYTYTVTITDNLGLSGSATGSFTVGIIQNIAPVIDSVAFAAGVLTVNVSDADGDPITVGVTEPAGLNVDAASKAAAAGVATFNWTAEDLFAGGSGTTTITANDGKDDSTPADQVINIGPIDLAADTIYAIPLSNSAATGAPVTIVVATGVPASPFQFCNIVAVTVESDGTYVANSLDFGVPGGGQATVDGIWSAVGASGFLPVADALITPTDIGGGRNRWELGCTPLGGSDQTTAKGAMFSFQFSFSAAGDKHVGFQEVGGITRTFYSGQDAAQKLWGVKMADETGAMDPGVTNVNNVITVN